jgi:CheY-like chemotaxis protein
MTATGTSLWSSALAAALRRPPSRRTPVILVVDDDRDTRELYRACFGMSGFVTAEASTGQEAITAAERLLPDVMLTDLILPDVDGFPVVLRLKAQRSAARYFNNDVGGHAPKDAMTLRRFVEATK